MALVPPLSVIGIGLSLGEQEIALGSSLLFLTNLICIIFFGSLVFLFQSYGNLDRAKKGLALSTVVMFALGFPLTLSMRDLIVKKNVTSNIANIIIDETDVFADADVEFISVVPRQSYFKINIEVFAPIDSISQNDIDRLRMLLTENLQKSVDLRVEVMPMRTIESPRE